MNREMFARRSSLVRVQSKDVQLATSHLSFWLDVDVDVVELFVIKENQNVESMIINQFEQCLARPELIVWLAFWFFSTAS